jgi:hypothetical protein
MFFAPYMFFFFCVEENECGMHCAEKEHVKGEIMVRKLITKAGQQFRERGEDGEVFPSGRDPPAY